MNYNERIKLFNKKINKEHFEVFKYMIIDEIQDLVNERAKMVLNILESIKCGFLLLGDTCQAIYDYDCNDEFSLKSTEFYENLLSTFDNRLDKFEFTNNKRQVEELVNYSEKIREVILECSDENRAYYFKECYDLFDEHNEYAEKFKLDSLNKKVAILCRNNGQAEKMSSILSKNKIEHILKRRNARINLDKWYALMFWDFSDEFITQEDFIKRYKFRVKEDVQEAENLFTTLKNISNSKSDDYIEISDLINKIKSLDTENSFLNSNVNNLIVSTIHKAKGMEFDEVYLVDNRNNQDITLEEAKVKYVALTRPKEKFRILNTKSNWYIKSLDDRSRNYTIFKRTNGFSHCTGITIGYDGDIDQNSFVSTQIHEDVFEIQRYICESVNKFDKLVIKRDFEKRRYLIYHSDKCIGALSENINDKFWKVIEETSNRNSIPCILENLYVQSIDTVFIEEFDENIPLFFRNSKNWLGISISGIAKVKYN